MSPAITLADIVSQASAFVVALLTEKKRTPTPPGECSRLRGVAPDGLAARRVITVAPGTAMTVRPCPVVVTVVSDIDKAASSASSPVPTAVASVAIPVADDRTPRVAVAVGAVSAAVRELRLQLLRS